MVTGPLDVIRLSADSGCSAAWLLGHLAALRPRRLPTRLPDFLAACTIVRWPIRLLNTYVCGSSCAFAGELNCWLKYWLAVWPEMRGTERLAISSN